MIPFLRTWPWRALVALVVVTAAGAVVGRWWLGPQVTTEIVLRRDFVQTVMASGHVEAPAGSGRTHLVVAIDERNMALLAPGQVALASADAYPDRQFAAELAYVNPGVDATTGAIEVKLDVVAPPAELRQGMAVLVDIEVARRQRLLIVPMTAVRDADAWPSVLRLERRRLVRRTVELGLRSGGFAEVLSGLDEGDSVLVGSTELESGARARALPLDLVRTASQ